MALTGYTSKDNQWREYVNPLLAVAFPGWPVEAGFELRMEDGLAGVAGG